TEARGLASGDASRARWETGICLPAAIPRQCSAAGVLAGVTMPVGGGLVGGGPVGGRPVARWIVALPSGGDLIERREAPFEASRNAARFFSHGSGTGMWIASVLWQHDRRFGHDHRAGAGSAHGVTASDNR